MKAYERYLDEKIDLATVGLLRRDEYAQYFCTPVGARILGTAGVDGIHYCFIDGFGETVFAVSPMNLPGEYVHPIAKSFEDLLCLILACGDLAALEQAHAWSRDQFNAFLAEYPPQEEVIAPIRAAFDLAPMEDPYGYIHTLQQSFDYGKLRYGPEYEQSVPKKPGKIWKVTYDGGFWSQQGSKGREIPIQVRFHWGEEYWLIPAVYACAKGLVVDFCGEVAPERVNEFLDKWSEPCQREWELTREEKEQIQRENPLDVDFTPTILVNGEPLRREYGCGLCWYPEGEEVPDEASDIVAHYGLDPSRGWILYRSSFRWASSPKPELWSLKLIMKRHPAQLPGPVFRDPNVGDTVTMTHPVTGQTHTLRVLEYAREENADLRTRDPMLEFPTHLVRMVYTLTPDLPHTSFRVRDTAEGDEPRVVQNGSVGIIGGQDGPTAVFISCGNPVRDHVSLSALHFAPAESVEWQVTWYEKLVPDLAVTLVK